MDPKVDNKNYRSKKALMSGTQRNQAKQKIISEAVEISLRLIKELKGVS